MLTGAILLVGTSSAEGPVLCLHETQDPPTLAFLEILGRSVFQRTVQRLVWSGATACAVLVRGEHASTVTAQLAALGPQIKGVVDVHVVGDLDEAHGHARRIAAGWSGRGIEGIFIAGLKTYAEVDLEDIADVLQSSGQPAIDIIDTQGDLDMWFVKAEALADGSVELNGRKDQEFTRNYLFCGYICRMTTFQDLRRFIVDVFHGRCEARPDGVETRPGIWVGEGAQVHRQARLVAPAYVGRHSKVGAATLITRCSSVEGNSYINDHTALENSSVLENTYVGAGLDVMHCIIHGKQLAHLRRNIVLDIEDPTLIGPNQVPLLRRVLRRYRDSKAGDLAHTYQPRAVQPMEIPQGKA